MDTDHDGVADVDIVVVEPDLLWRVDQTNALSRVNAASASTVLEAAAMLTPSTPAVVVVGPNAIADALEHLASIRPHLPLIEVAVVVADPKQGDVLDRETYGPVRVCSAQRNPEELAEEFLEMLERSRAGSPTTADGSTTLTLAAWVLVTEAVGTAESDPIAATLAELLAAGADGPRVALVAGDPVFGNLALRFGAPAPIVADLTPGLADVEAFSFEVPSGVRLVLPPRPHSAFAGLDPIGFVALLAALDPLADIVVVSAPLRLAAETSLTQSAAEVLIAARPDLIGAKNALIATDVVGRRDGVGLVVRDLDVGDALTHTELERHLRVPIVAGADDLEGLARDILARTGR